MKERVTLVLKCLLQGEKCNQQHLTKMGTIMYIEKHIPSLSVFPLYPFCLCPGRTNCLVNILNKPLSTNNKCWRGCGEKGTLLLWWWQCKFVLSLWRTVWRFLQKLKIELPYDPTVPLLGI